MFIDEVAASMPCALPDKNNAPLALFSTAEFTDLANFVMLYLPKSTDELTEKEKQGLHAVAEEISVRD